jgi:hypothetical protein
MFCVLYQFVTYLLTLPRITFLIIHSFHPHVTSPLLLASPVLTPPPYIHTYTNEQLGLY